LTLDLDDAAARRWLVSGLALVRIGEPSLAALSAHGPWIGELVSERGATPPVGVVIDLGRMLGGATTAAAAPPPAVAPALQEALRGYQDQLLGRLEASPLFDPLVDEFAPLAPDLQARALAIVVGRMLDRIGFAAAVRVRPALVRELARAPLDELAAWADGAGPELTAAYAALAAGARRSGPAIDATDLFLVERVAALGDLGQRIAVEQMAAATTELLAGLPRRLKPRPRAEVDPLATRLDHEETYPTGGFASMSTAGPIENLVSSELVYMEDDAELDLFDLRYAERELLYYTRDDSLFRRGRRALRLALLPDLARARVKDPEAPVQRTVALWGLVGAVVDRLVAWLETAALAVSVVFVESDAAAGGPARAPDGRDPIDPPGAAAGERALAEILLATWIERGVVSIESAPDLAHVVDAAAADAGTGESTLVVATAEPARVVAAPRSLALAVLHLDAARPRLCWSRRPAAPAPAEEVAAAWRAAAVSLLSQVV
jgi:hypothetical protein